MINGKIVGNTSLIVWEQGGERQFFNVTVHPSRAAADESINSLRRELKAAMPGQNITVVSENNLVFLRGTVNDLASSDRAVQIASSAGKVVNLLYVNVPHSPPQILLKVRFASAAIRSNRPFRANEMPKRPRFPGLRPGLTETAFQAGILQRPGFVPYFGVSP